MSKMVGQRHSWKQFMDAAPKYACFAGVSMPGKVPFLACKAGVFQTRANVIVGSNLRLPEKKWNRFSLAVFAFPEK